MNTQQHTINHQSLIAQQQLQAWPIPDTALEQLQRVCDNRIVASENQMHGSGSQATINDTNDTHRSRWVSLLDLLYHSNLIPHCKGLRPGAQINAARCGRARTLAKQFLDSAFPLLEGSHEDVRSYMVYYQNLMIMLADGSTTGLANPAQFVALSGPRGEPCSVALAGDGFHTELMFNKQGKRGRHDLADIDDILIEPEAAALFDEPSLQNGNATATGNYQNANTQPAQARVLTGRDGEDYVLRG